MSAAKEKHTHKFKRLKYKSGNVIFFCSLPDCTFKTNIALALGKRSICWRCSQPFIMNEYSLRLAKPHCDSCHRPKESEPPIFPENRSLKQGEIPAAQPNLAERLKQLTQQKQEEEL